LGLQTVVSLHWRDGRKDEPRPKPYHSLLSGTMRSYSIVVLPLIVMIVSMYLARIGFYWLMCIPTSTARRCGGRSRGAHRLDDIDLARLHAWWLPGEAQHQCTTDDGETGSGGGVIGLRVPVTGKEWMARSEVECL